jgi:Co/Zn/Cd efflux system component
MEKTQNINVDAAYLHVLGDLLMSVGVTIAATIIYFFPNDKYPWSKYVDPACTLIFSIIVFYTCKKTLSNCFFILM